MKTIQEPAREIPVAAEKDVVVVGGGPSGVMAAIAAARMGADTLLAEINGFLGGPLAMYLPIQGFIDREGRQIVKGLAQEFVDRLRAKEGAYHKFTVSRQTNDLLIIDAEAVKLVCQEMVLEAGVEIHLHTMFTDAHPAGEKPSAVIVQNKSGRQAVTGRFFIDATGDGDLAAGCRARYTVGRDTDGLPQSATLTFRVDGVDEDVVRRAILDDPERFDICETCYSELRLDRKHQVVGFRNLIKEAKAEGFPVPFGKVLYCSLLQEGAMLINMTHVENVRCHVAADLTRAEIEAREQVPIIFEFLKRYVPGFEKAQLTSTAHAVGVRETRHIEGDYTLTLADVRAGRRFDDTIGLCGYPVDIHSPDATDVNLEHIPTYGIPYRCLTPKSLDNVLVVGRALSATHEALASVRVMAPCMAMGQAAGVAAALAVKTGKTSRQIDFGMLRSTLLAQGAVLD